jgi:putative transposase
LKPRLIGVEAATTEARPVQRVLAFLRDRLPEHIKTTPAERARLLRYGGCLGKAITKIITIVQPATFFKWINQRPRLLKPRGPRRTPEQIRALVLKIARATDWGYCRIGGELKKLGIYSVKRTTVATILKEEDIEPAPERTDGTWDLFIKRHADTLWACDFFTKKVWTLFGVREYYILFFIHAWTRQAYIAGFTEHPNAAWMAQQARNLCMFFDEQLIRPTLLYRDRDRKYTKQFDGILKSYGIEVVKLPPYSPNLNVFAERWVKTIKTECLNHFIVFGEKHLDYLLQEYLNYYNHFRPHQGIGNVTPLGLKHPPPEDGSVRCTNRLGGVIKQFYPEAA